MSSQKYQQTKLSQYRPPEFLVDDTDLVFRLDERNTTIDAQYSIRLNPAYQDAHPADLHLFGETIELLTCKIDGQDVQEGRLQVDDYGLSIAEVPDAFTLSLTTRCHPADNHSLSGLYISSNIFCTQCEAEGFRRMTYFPDRPDVLSRYRVRIEAPAASCPVLLSNGNLVEQGELPGGFHFCTYHDPFPKPSYLFALVAGELSRIDDVFTTASGRDISLQVYVQPQNIQRCGHAMRSLKKAMEWDEQVYGLEYDLDQYKIVAVDDFNMGAMENKGLNVFNSKYVLATPETATDQDYLGIEGVIAHEYFHNWTGNRVTCRDWFQLSLKEGLTVFRDQEFSADLNSRPVKRIDDVRLLRRFQFPEDDSPMAHPVRPDTYMEINNFYTVTVYNKGAEVVRMLHSLIGPGLFRRGMDLYFARHDGQAVTCDDFVAAMEEASGRDFDQFKRWYSQAGTPRLSVNSSYDKKKKTYRLTITQQTGPTPGQPSKDPFHIPIKIGLLDKEGRDLLGDSSRPELEGSALLELVEQEQSFTFGDIDEEPVLSFLRGFSAPVRVEDFQSREGLAFLVGHDTDSFNRWDGAHKLHSLVILDTLENLVSGRETTLPTSYVQAVGKNLILPISDQALTARALQLPSEGFLKQELDVIDPEALHHAHMRVKTGLAQLLEQDFLALYSARDRSATYELLPAEIGARTLQNVCLDYLVSICDSGSEIAGLCRDQYFEANNMTERFGALAAIVHLDISERTELFENFERRYDSDPLLMDKWFSLQASSSAGNTFEMVLGLQNHRSFSLKNPNKVRALIGAFCQNHFHFHRADGSGYTFLADNVIELDAMNPQMAARLVNPLISWQRYDTSRQLLIQAELQRIQGRKHISRDVYEIVKKSLETNGS